MSSTPRIAWRNLWRNPGRTALCAGAIAIAQLTLVFTGAFFNAWFDGMRASVTGPMLGAVQVHAPGWREDHAIDRALADSDALATRVAALPGVASVSARLYAPVLVASGDEAKAALLVGVDAGTEGDGGLLAATPARPGERTVVIGRGLADRLHVVEGSELALVGQGADGSVANDLFHVGGVMRSAVQEIERNGIVMSLADARDFLVLPGQAHELVVRARPGADDRVLAASIAALPPLAGDEVLSWRQLAPILDRLLEMVGWATAVSILLVFSASAAGIANTMMMSVFERRRETGMLLALGCGPGRVIAMLATEALALGAIGVVAGSVAGIALSLWARAKGIDLLALAGGNVGFEGLNFMGVVRPRLAGGDVLRGAAGVMITTMIAMLWPALSAARMQPAEGLRA